MIFCFPKMKAFFSLQGGIQSERLRRRVCSGVLACSWGHHTQYTPLPWLVDAAILGDYSISKATFLGITLCRGQTRSPRPFVLSKILNVKSDPMQTLPASNISHIFISHAYIWKYSHGIRPASSLDSQGKLPASFVTEMQACDPALSSYTSM